MIVLAAILGLVVGLLGGALIVQHSRIYDLLLTDRDKARAEVETLRAALFPQLAQTRGKQANPRAQAAPASSAALPAFSPNLRIPFRRWFKMQVAAHNSGPKANIVQEVKNA